MEQAGTALISWPKQITFQRGVRWHDDAREEEDVKNEFGGSAAGCQENFFEHWGRQDEKVGTEAYSRGRS